MADLSMMKRAKALPFPGFENRFFKNLLQWNWNAFIAKDKTWRERERLHFKNLRRPHLFSSDAKLTKKGSNQGKLKGEVSVYR